MRGRSEPEHEDLIICHATGWTLTELMVQPVEFVERFRVYLEAVSDKQSRETRRVEEEFEAKLRRVRI